jgi:hypothetical protein
MSLPPLPETNTKRYWLSYHVKSSVHHCQMRVSDDFTDTDAIDALTALAVAIQPLWHSDAGADGVLVADNGSNVRNPVSGFTPVVGTLGGTTSDINIPFETTWSGRARSGRKWDLGIFGLNYTLTTSWRITALSGTGLDTIRAIFVDTANAFLTIAGDKPIFNNWANFSYNDHWVKAERVS